MTRPLFTPFRLLLVLLLAGYTSVMLWPGVLMKLGFSFHEEWFLDSHAILAANDAARLGADPAEPNPLDALRRPHVYSDWWLGLRWLGLGRADNFAFGGTCVVAFLIVALAGVRPATYRAALGLAAMFLAPSTLFALQRANNDLVIFALVGAGLLALRPGFSPWRLAGFGALVAVATGLKYYPVVAVGALVAVLPWRRANAAIFTLTAIAALVALWSERASLGRGMFELPQTIHLFGASLLARDLALGRGALAALSMVIVGLGALWVSRARWTEGLADSTRGPDAERLMFAVGSCLLVGCFLAGTSYAYRWIFGLWLFPWLWREAGTGRTAARAAFVCWFVSLWADGLLCAVVNFAGLPYRPALGWRVVTQPFTWALIILLAGWLFEALLAQARAWRLQGAADGRPSADSSSAASTR